LADIKYRQKALENIATPKALDDMIQVTTAKAWIALTAIFIILIAALSWVFFGTILTRVTGQGILYAEKNQIINVSALYQSGRVKEIKIHLNMPVKKNQVLAILENTSIAIEIQIKKKYMHTLIKEYQNLRIHAIKAIKKKKADYRNKKRNLKEMMMNERVKRQKLYKLIQGMRKAVKQGVITREKYIDEQIRYLNLKQVIAKHKSDVINLEFEKSKIIDTWQERLRALSEKIAAQEHTISLLEEKDRISKKILSPVAGFVSQIEINVGDFVKRNHALFKVSTKNQDLEAITYVPAKLGKKIKRGMLVKISPSTVEKFEYGDIKGIVTDVANFPSSSATMQSQLQNKELVAYFQQQGPLIAVKVKLLQDPHTFSGYQWTSSSGPKTKITAGTLITINIVVKKAKPISLVIPRILKLLKQ